MKYGIKYLLRTIKSSKWYSLWILWSLQLFIVIIFRCNAVVIHSFMLMKKKMEKQIIIVVGI